MDSPAPKAPVSVLLLTLNEEDNLPHCLASVAWADDILVLDSFSTDRTVEVAQAHGARVMQRAFDTFAGQRNFGLQEGGLRHDWVLHLDADEVVPPALREELLSRLADADALPAYRVASKMMFHGRWLRRSGIYPSYQVRFGLRDRLGFVQVGHGQREALAPEEVGTLREPLEHYSFSKGLDDWYARHNRYSRAEADQALADADAPMPWLDLLSTDATRRRRALKRLAAHMPFRPTLRFLYMYVLRLGLLDGRPGLAYCRLLATYESMIVAKIKEARWTQAGQPP